jgi:hypothetical protein
MIVTMSDSVVIQTVVNARTYLTRYMCVSVKPAVFLCA